MSEFGDNTESAGGTRFSEGKVTLVWTPWAGLDRVWKYAHELRSDVGPTEDPECLLLEADDCLRWAMNGGNDFPNFAGEALYRLLTLCHRWETGQTEVVRDEDPIYPSLGMWAVGRVSEYGASKYAPFDWLEGQSYSTLLSCARRHLDKAMTYGPYSIDSAHGDPEDDSEYSGLPHVGHAAWNLACLLHFCETGRRWELDDVTAWRGITTLERLRIDEVADETTVGRAAWQVARDFKNEAGRGSS